MSTKQTEKEIEILKKENERLHEMLDQYKNLFQQSLESVISFDSNGFLTEVNEAACRLFELSKEKLISKNFHSFLVLESAQTIATLTKTLHEEGVIKGKLSIRVGSRKVKEIQYTVRKSDEGNDIAILRDISRKRVLERQRNVSKQLFMDVYNRAVDGIVIFDRNGMFINSNKSFMTNFDLTKDELLKSTIYDFIEPEYLFKIEKLWSILEEKERAKGELPVKLKNGEKKIFEFTITANIFDHYYMFIMRDVTQRKQMERKLRDSEIRFREIFDTAMDAIVIWADGGKVISANNSASKIFELPLEQFIRGSLFDFIDLNNPEVIEIAREFIEKGEQRAEHDFYMGNGQIKRLEFTSKYKVLDGYNMTIFRNVSEKRLMEKTLREKEQKFRKIFECALDGIILWNNEFKIVDVNPVASEILKVQKNHLLTKNIDQIFANYSHLDSTDSFSRNETEEVYEERPLILDNGEKRTIEFAVKRNVTPNLNMTIIRDVTERKNIEFIIRENEHKFRQLYDNALNGFIIIDDDGNIVDMNPEAKRIFGLENDVLLPLSLQKFTFLDEKEKEVQWKKLLENASLTGQFTVSNRIIEYTLSKNIYMNHHLTILHDVTKRNEMEEQLRKSDTLTIVGELAAGIAHEIRNPLTALKGFIQLLQGNVKEDFSMYFDVITSELKRIETIITEFLVLAKPQATQYQQSDLKRILQETIDLLTPQASLENVQIKIEVESESAEIFCEPNQLKQVFINILKNGIEVMPKGGTIYTSIEQHEEDIVKISFRDQGCGITKDKIKRLGEPFYTTKERGTGLGLMVSFKIISEHKGKIEVISKEGEGSTFDIYLPKNQEGNTKL